MRPYCIGTSYRTNFSIETIISSRSPCRRFNKSVHHRVQPPREASGSFFSPYRYEEILLCMHARSDRACGVSEEPSEQPVITRIADRSVSPFLYHAVCFTLHPVSGPWNIRRNARWTRSYTIVVFSTCYLFHLLREKEDPITHTEAIDVVDLPFYQRYARTKIYKYTFSESKAKGNPYLGYPNVAEPPTVYILTNRDRNRGRGRGRSEQIENRLRSRRSFK